MTMSRFGELLLAFSLGVLTTLIFTGAGNPIAWPIFGVLAATGMVMTVVSRDHMAQHRDEDHQAKPSPHPYSDQPLAICLICKTPIALHEGGAGGWQHTS